MRLHCDPSCIVPFPCTASSKSSGRQDRTPEPEGTINNSPHRTLRIVCSFRILHLTFPWPYRCPRVILGPFLHDKNQASNSNTSLLQCSHGPHDLEVALDFALPYESLTLLDFCHGSCVKISPSFFALCSLIHR